MYHEFIPSEGNEVHKVSETGHSMVGGWIYVSFDGATEI
jgi:hypothetical protein